MAISKEEVQHIARLARLRFSDKEQDQMAEEMSQVLDYMDTLREVDTAGVPPMAHVLTQENVFRDDEVEQRIKRKDALTNAPETDGTYVLVPRVID